MFSKSLLMLAGLALAASPAPAADQSKNKTPPRAQEKTYCIQLEPFTGSHLNPTKCLTKKQWELQGVDVDELLAK